MYNIGICGHFGFGLDLLNGQTIKTKMISEELENYYGKNQVSRIDTHGWKHNPVSMIIRSLKLLARCETIILLPAHNGVRVLIPLFLFLNKIYRRKIYYIVIGGWLSELLKQNNNLRLKVSKLNGVFVETNYVIEELNNINVKNTYILPNFKRLDILKEEDLIFNTRPVFKLCIFSRVTDKKGIEDAISVIKSINDDHGEIKFSLDIYGQIDDSYKERFMNLEKSFPDYIKYKGAVNFVDSVNILKNYFLLLFPTQYKTEGIPGTIIDAYAAGVPVIASGWNSAKEVIVQGQTGFAYKFMNNTEFKRILLEILDDPISANNMKVKCLERASQYKPETVMKKFIEDTLK